jgi:G protein-coupled receptor GPR1
MRSLFFYPVIYVLMWLFPLINQVYGQVHAVGTPKPLWLRCLSHSSFALQGLVNTTVFLTYEKPWRHARGSGFWAGVRGKLAGKSTGIRGNGAGQMQDEMLVSILNARARRAEEIELERRRVTSLAEIGAHPQSIANWWDRCEVD